MSILDIKLHDEKYEDLMKKQIELWNADDDNIPILKTRNTGKNNGWNKDFYVTIEIDGKPAHIQLGQIIFSPDHCAFFGMIYLVKDEIIALRFNSNNDAAIWVGSTIQGLLYALKCTETWFQQKIKSNSSSFKLFQMI